MLIAFFWVFIGAQLPKLLNRRAAQNSRLISLVGILLAAVIGMGLTSRFPGEKMDSWNEDAAPWAADSDRDLPEPRLRRNACAGIGHSAGSESTESEEKQVDDRFVWIEGGAFLMGSPETENWRIDDETQHEVTVSGFWMSPYEVTQAEYERLMGVNPSSFQGENLPVESVSWLDAVRFCNAKSAEAGLTPAYAIDGKP